MGGAHPHIYVHVSQNVKQGDKRLLKVFQSLFNYPSFPILAGSLEEELDVLYARISLP
jgi:hypothetical protein